MAILSGALNFLFSSTPEFLLLQTTISLLFYIFLVALGDTTHMCCDNPPSLSHIPLLSRSYYLERGSGLDDRLTMN